MPAPCAFERSIPTDRPVPGVEIVPWLVLKRGKLYSVNLCGSCAKVRTDAQGVATFDWFPSDVRAWSELRVWRRPSYFLPKWPHPRGGKPDAELTARVFRVHADLGQGHAARRLAGGRYPRRRRGRRRRVSSRLEPGADRRRRFLQDGAPARTSPTRSTWATHEWAAASRTGVVVREGKPLPGRRLPSRSQAA